MGGEGVAFSCPVEGRPLPLCPDGPSARQVVFHDLEVLAQKLQPTVEAMQKLFSAGAGSYYGDSLFFLSVAMHHIMPRGEWATGGASVPLACLQPSWAAASVLQSLLQSHPRRSPGPPLWTRRRWS